MTDNHETREAGRMRVTYDDDVDAAYIELKPIAAGESRRQHHAETRAGDIVLDFDHDGALIGVELLRGSLLHPSLMAIAVKPGEGR